MSKKYDAIVIGGGVIGCGVLFGLAERGMSNTLLLEKNELTSGSTWHAAGNCTHFGHDAKITQLYVNTLKTYLRAEAESGQNISFHKTGSLRLANSPVELASFNKLTSLYEELEIPYQVISAKEIKKYHPLMNLEGVLGAAYTPDDGHVDPTGVTMAMAKAAQLNGAKILRQHPVNGIEKLNDDSWKVISNDEEFYADRVILATSFWAREMLLALGIDVPIYALEHHEIITESHAEVKELSFELPTVRDQTVPCNVRQEANGFLMGIYEKHPIAWNTNGIPPEFGQELLPPNIERLMDHIETCMWRFPIIGETGIKISNNGPICYTPDGFPMVGPVSTREHEGLWLATGFSVGIGTGGGTSQFLSDWIVNGEPPYELDAIHPKRFLKPISKDKAIKDILAVYAAGYGTPE